MVNRRFYYIPLAIIAIVIAGYFYISHNLTGRASSSPVEQTFEIKEGEGVNPIASNLQKQGIVSHRLWFEFYIWSKDKEKNIIAGTYILRPNMTNPEIVDNITSGKAQKKDQNITIIEGWTNKKIGENLASKGILSKEEFIQEASALEKYRPYYTFLQEVPKEETLEGYLFPDTYNVIKGKTTAGQLVNRMLNNFNKKLTDTLKADIKKSGRDLHDVIKMASIIEKEVPTDNDRKIVSGIFWDRVENNYPLESCATISYILGVNKKQYTFEDTRIDSPYNTYINKGLTPGPIGNPGISAIKAAIYPQKTDYAYFQSSPQNGETVFSRTLEEHNRNKDEYGL